MPNWSPSSSCVMPSTGTGTTPYHHNDLKRLFMHNPLNRCASIPARVRSNKAAAPFAQKSSSINLDTQGCEGQDHVEVLPFKARLPLPSPRQFVEQLSSASSAKRSSTSSARFSPPARGLTSCPTYRTARPGPRRFHAATLEPDSLHARTVFSFLKEENTKCQNKTKLSSVVLLKKFGTRAICRW